MINDTLIITNKAGLHARAAAKLVETTTQFSSTIELGAEGKMVDGKSILSVMLLAAAIGTELTLKIDGKDEDQALIALHTLSKNHFGEE